MAGGRSRRSERADLMVADFRTEVPLSQRSVAPEGLALSGDSEPGGYTFSMPTTAAGAAMALQPLPAAHATDAHLHSLAHRGYTILDSVVPPPLLATLRERFDVLIARVQRGDCSNGAADAAGIVEVSRVYEEEPAFESLMDLPAVHAVAAAAMGGTAEPRLLGGPFAHYVPPGTGSDMPWHRDGDVQHGQWLRLTYTLDDVDPGGGGTGIMPGSHLWQPGAPVPGWANDPHSGAALDLPGRDEFCAPAGSCMLSWTFLWHCRLPNASEDPRRLLWQLYRRPDQPTWHRSEHLLSQDYFRAQAAASGPGEADEARLRLLGMGKENGTPWVGGWIEEPWRARRRVLAQLLGISRL